MRGSRQLQHRQTRRCGRQLLLRRVVSVMLAGSTYQSNEAAWLVGRRLPGNQGCEASQVPHMRVERDHGDVPSSKPSVREFDAAIRAKAGLAVNRRIGRPRAGVANQCFGQFQVRRVGLKSCRCAVTNRSLGVQSNCSMPIAVRANSSWTAVPQDQYRTLATSTG